MRVNLWATMRYRMGNFVDRTNVMKQCTASLLVLCLAVASAAPLRAAEVGQRFSSVADFVKSFPRGAVDIEAGYGDLAGAGRRDWAGVVSMQHLDGGNAEDGRQIAVLTQQPDGSYRVAAQGPVYTGDGGTAHHGIDGISIRQGSLFVKWSWNWHGCSGGSTQQIKFYKGQWRVIGAEFTQNAATETADGAYDDGDSATMSHNLLTGAVVIHFMPLHGKEITKRFNQKPTTVLLDDNFGEDVGAVEEFSKYAGC